VTSRSSDQAEKFTELFRANRLDILKYLIRRSASPEEAADALAETFLVAWRRIDIVPYGLEGRLWLYGVARNVLFKQFAKIVAGSAGRGSASSPGHRVRILPTVSA